MVSSKKITVAELDARIEEGSGYHPKNEKPIDVAFFEKKEKHEEELHKSRLLIAAILQKESDRLAKKPVEDAEMFPEEMFTRKRKG